MKKLLILPILLVILTSCFSVSCTSYGGAIEHRGTILKHDTAVYYNHGTYGNALIVDNL